VEVSPKSLAFIDKLTARNRMKGCFENFHTPVLI